jgi:uncharacterized protein YfaP (DUF2135 family)
VKYKDASGNISQTYSDTITLQNAASGTLRGQVKDAVTQANLSGVQITVSDTTGTVVGTTQTVTDGTLSITLASGNGYTVALARNGYIPVTISNVTVVANTDTFLPVVMQIDTNHNGAGTVSGTVINAFTGQGVPSATVNLRAGINTTTGTIIASATSAADGTYSITNLAAGNYTAEVSVTGFTTVSATVVCVGGVTTANQNITITPLLSAGETRIVLTWGATPSDLDSHLTGPNGLGGRFHIYYSNKTYVLNSTTMAGLDVDDTTSFGPETTTIYVQSDGTYRFSVHDYTNRTATDSTALSASAAKVEVYQGASLVAEFNVPPNTGGTLWTVFELNGTTIVPVNTMARVG